VILLIHFNIEGGRNSPGRTGWLASALLVDGPVIKGVKPLHGQEWEDQAWDGSIPCHIMNFILAMGNEFLKILDHQGEKMLSVLQSLCNQGIPCHIIEPKGCEVSCESGSISHDIGQFLFKNAGYVFS
jgi:hypothetical protein